MDYTCCDGVLFCLKHALVDVCPLLLEFWVGLWFGLKRWFCLLGNRGDLWFGPWALGLLDLWEVLYSFIVFAWNLEGALWTPSIVDEVSLDGVAAILVIT